MNNQKKYSAVILGGGIAGITTALELARLGQNVVLVEKTPFFGGRAAHFCCKATDACQKCGACLVEERLNALFMEPRITLMPHTELMEVSRENGLFRLVLKKQPEVINPARCVDCGLCYDECPAADQGAILTTGITQNHPRYAVNPKACLYFQDGSCEVCQHICPPTAKAIDLTRPAKTIELIADAVVLATGYRPSDPKSRPHYGYGRLPQIITGFELEERLRNGKGLKGPGGELPRRIAFIQCVGSRDKDHPYCSQVCCAYTLRLARFLKHRVPEAEVTSFYMDLQEIGRCSLQFQAEARREIKVVRALPGDLHAAGAGHVKLRYLEEESGRPAEAEVDLVVLSVGIAPGEDNPALAAMLNTELTPDGFFQAANPGQRSQTSQPGLFLAGTAEGPRDIAGCIAQATVTACQVSRYVNER
ncbi:MAG: FAD-dependent oxidoreductase [Thermodesulfobacteriota bacterium]